MRRIFIEFWLNNKAQNQQEVYDNVTRFLIKNGGVKIVGNGLRDIVFSIWDFEGLIIYVELCGGDCKYRFLN